VSEDMYGTVKSHS